MVKVTRKFSEKHEKSESAEITPKYASHKIVGTGTKENPKMVDS